MRFSSQRRATIVVGITAGALALAACGGGTTGGAESLDPKADLSKQTLVVSNWDPYMPAELPADFTAKFGTPVKVAVHATNEEIMAKLTAAADSGIDVAFVSGQFAQALNKQGLLEPIHPELIPNLANLYPEASQMKHDPGNTFSVPYTWGTSGLCYREDLTGYTPDSWNDLLKPSDELKGKTTMLATERWLMMPAQKVLGFSVNTTSEEEMAKVKEQLVETEKTLLAFDDTTMFTRLVNGEAALTQTWDGWCNYGIADNDKIKWIVPKEGSDLWADTMVILKTSKNKEAAHAFVNNVLEPEVHSWVTENFYYKVPNKAAMERLDPALIAAYPNVAMTPAELLKGEQFLDLGEAGPMYTKIATEIAAQ